MKYLLFLIILLTNSACAEQEFCDPQYINRCHTRKEWDKISENNWKSIECMEKVKKDLSKTKIIPEEKLKIMYKKCNFKEIITIGVK